MDKCYVRRLLFILIFVTLIIVPSIKAEVVVPSIDTIDEMAYERIVLYPQKQGIEIQEQNIEDEAGVLATENIETSKAKELIEESARIKDKLSAQLKNVDLRLVFYLTRGTAEAQGQKRPYLYQKPGMSEPIGYIKLPAYLIIIKQDADFIKIRITKDSAAWINAKEIDPDELLLKIDEAQGNALRSIEKKNGVKRSYYKQELSERWSYSTLGILGSTVLMLDGGSKLGFLPFAGKAIAGLANSTATILGTLEVIIGGYLGYQSIDHLISPQEKYIYQQVSQNIDGDITAPLVIPPQNSVTMNINDPKVTTPGDTVQENITEAATSDQEAAVSINPQDKGEKK